MKELRNIYFVQAGDLFGDNAHFPYASGCVAAYAWSNPVIRGHFRLGHYTLLRTPVDQAAASFEDPYLVAFSNYCWNYEYHKVLARAVKARWPGCLILFGGHQVLNDSPAQLEGLPFVDYLIHKAGEIPFEQLLLALLRGEGPGGVPSLSYRGPGGKALRTPDDARAAGRSCEFPSPYLTGAFDSLYPQYASILTSITIETNRGCPHGCAFCDWGTVRHGLQCMPMERVKAEIDWAAAHKIEFIYCTDSNFGILARDEEIAGYLIESKRRTGYPVKFNANFTKNSNETVFRLNQKLGAEGLSHGATLSFQSLAPAALENIGRKNMSFERFRELLSLYNGAGVPVYSELIVGLPGETLESYARGIGTLLEAGMHGALEVYFCELLPNAGMSGPAYREKHGVKGVRVRRYQRFGAPGNQDEIPEYAEILCESNTMPAADWVAANVFSTAVQGLHGLGLLPYCAIYLHKEQGLPYERFYLDLMAYAKASPSTLLGELFAFFEKRFRALARGEGENAVYCDPRFGEVTWPPGAALFLCAAYGAERLYGELPAFLRQYGMDGDVLAQLLRFQRAAISLPGSQPPGEPFGYDFPGYFTAALAGKPAALQERRTMVSFPAQPLAWADFAREHVWYGRRKGSLVKRVYDVTYG